MRTIHPDINTPLPSNHYDWENIILFQNENIAKKNYLFMAFGSIQFDYKRRRKIERLVTKYTKK